MVFWDNFLVFWDDVFGISGLLFGILVWGIWYLSLYRCHLSCLVQYLSRPVQTKTFPNMKMVHRCQHQLPMCGNPSTIDSLLIFINRSNKYQAILKYQEIWNGTIQIYWLQETSDLNIVHFHIM